MARLLGVDIPNRKKLSIHFVTSTEWAPPVLKKF